VSHIAYFLLLQFQRPGEDIVWPLAVLVFDPSRDRLHVCGRHNFADIADHEDVIVLSETVKQLLADANIQSGTAILELLEDTLSNSIRLTERMALRSSDIATTVQHLSAALLF
jgi:hypothetical protein